MASSGFEATRFEATKDFARNLDSQDPLASYRDRFHTPRGPNGDEWVYLTGHSLGLQPKSAREYVERELQLWQELAVEGHFHGPQPWVLWWGVFLGAPGYGGMIVRGSTDPDGGIKSMPHGATGTCCFHQAEPAP